MKRFIIFTLLLLLVQGCFLFKNNGVARYPTIRNNVCKSLNGKVILYAVFVDSKGIHPWTEYDIKSTKDSILRAVNWLEDQAKQNGVNLDIDFQYYSKNDIIPVRGKFKYETLGATLFHYKYIYKGIKLVDDWSNSISRTVARGLPKSNSTKVLTKNKMNDRERLIARLRDLYGTDNIALLFFTNSYFENELSVALHTASGEETEYAVLSEKRPSVIAHEFLHLFGTEDLYLSQFDRNGKSRRKKKKIMKYYPNEIMAFAHRNIDSLGISPLSKYLLGWDNKLDKNARGLITRKRQKLLEY